MRRQICSCCVVFLLMMITSPLSPLKTTYHIIIITLMLRTIYTTNNTISNELSLHRKNLFCLIFKIKNSKYKSSKLVIVTYLLFNTPITTIHIIALKQPCLEEKVINLLLSFVIMVERGKRILLLVMLLRKARPK